MKMTPPSHSTGRQLAHTGAEMIVNMVPVFGGTMAVALTIALNHTLNKRRERWFTRLAEAVDELQGRFAGFDPDALAENEAFVDAVVTATRIVDRTSQEEKIEVLRNAVLNSALPTAPHEDVQQLYFTMIDDLTPTHMQLLTLLNDPPGWFDARPHLQRPQFAMSSSRTALIQAAMPDLAALGTEMIERFYAALTNDGLVTGALSGMMTTQGAWQPVTTEYAARLLAFVRDPRKA